MHGEGKIGPVRALRVVPPFNMIGWEGTTARATSPNSIPGGRFVSATDCLFCKVASGEIPATLVHEDDRLVAFRDIGPQAPVHILVIPREHIASLEAAADDHEDLLGAMLLVARDLARAEGIAEDGYRTVLNVGADGGQTVLHIHLHLIGGRALDWPPG
jgi:histidine triad (HIT) family protein